MPLILISELAVHTKNLARDARASLLFVDEAGGEDDTNARGRVSVDGVLEKVADRAAARARFVRRHPAAGFYADFGDFSFMRLVVERAHLVAGFGRITSLSPADLLAPEAAASALAEVDEGACAHMDEDHPDALELIATRLCGGAAGAWRAAGIDPLGVDLVCGERTVRAEFDALIDGPGPLRVALKRLTDRARAA